jgi:signal transduction histidine kinase
MTALAGAHSRTLPLGEQELTDLVRSVNDVASQLQATHQRLQEEVSRLRSELADANAQLRRSQALAALGEMAAGIAHEVRNPLASIQLYVQMLADDLKDRPAQAGLCAKISRSVEGLDAIVRDVLLFARQRPAQTQATSAAEVLDRALDACESLIAAGTIDVRRDRRSEGACRLQADVPLLTQALANVIRNAIEAIVEGPAASRVLQVSVSRQARRTPCGGTRAARVVFTIDDSGPGVPDDVVQRMFNPFFTTRRTGTGLGLAIVHRIIDSHGGEVCVHDSPLGGARFELCLPMQRACPIVTDQERSP